MQQYSAFREPVVIFIPKHSSTQSTEDPYNLEALQAIDDKLAKLVPESEWEAPQPLASFACCVCCLPC